MSSIASYFTGWEFLAPAYAVIAIGGSWLLRSTRPRLAPWVVGVVWAVLFVGLYLMIDVGRYWVSERVMWAATSFAFLLLATLAVLPTAWYVFSPRGRRRSTSESALIGFVLGIVSIPLLGIASRLAAVLIGWWVPVG